MEDFKKVLAAFGGDDIYEAAHALLTALEVPVQRLKSTRYSTLDFFSVSHPSHYHIDAIYAAGLVTDEAFDEKSDGETLESALKKDKYDALGVFVVEVNKNKPSRSLLSDLTRRINRQTTGFPVLVIFKYSIDDQVHIAFANAAREDYKRTTQEGEKIGKVSILRDINTNQLHAGHERMLIELAIKRKGSNPVNSYEELYAYWQKVFDVSLLSKKFYRELSNWYFWALKEVRFPNGPNIFDENIDGDEKKHREAIIEHNGKNVIRMLTRILFVWFVKEKGLVPELLFDERFIESELLKDFTPQKPQGIFSTGKTNSKYYRAVLQNLFFGGLNQERGKRAFRKAKMHHNVTNLMRYEECFKDGQLFIDLLENNVPFMNGGLFECLDEPHPEKKGKKGGDIIIYNDGFSDRPDNLLSVPDYLFFDLDEEVDLSDVSGIKSADYKKAKTRGLLQILKSYKFTISENTPIEEDVALDPELLGKVFENLLASYNPETKTTARKQTGSFYTPREIVNYMIDESLIAYLKNTLIDTSMSDELLDEKLRELVSFDAINPFVENHEYTKSIINALDKCKILDPACGSGAFPMGALQKMVHLLQKLDPDNEHWKEIQLKKAMEATEAVFAVKDKSERETRLIEISDAFDVQINDADYARKLFLIENCIYGVDIQPIATQISKLRFFISLVVEQRVSKKLDNFGIRPLPNLETKFVTANTLIGIDNSQGQQLSNTERIKELQTELKDIRHKLFSAKTKGTKLKYREKDEELRRSISEELISSGWQNQTAKMLAQWDPYDQNACSSFFDTEWMFDLNDGFDVVIGNPPYISYYGNTGANLTDNQRLYIVQNYSHVQTKNDRINSMNLMTEKAMQILKINGVVYFITNKTQAVLPSYKNFREYILKHHTIQCLVDHLDPFEAIVDCIILGMTNGNSNVHKLKYFSGQLKTYNYLVQNDFNYNPQYELSHSANDDIINLIESHTKTIDQILTINRGVNIGGCFEYFLSENQIPEYFPYLAGTKNIKPFIYSIFEDDGYFKFDLNLEARLRQNGATIVLGNPERYILPHLFIPESGQRIMAAFCDQKIYGSYGLLIGTNPHDVNFTKAACSILNSSIITFYCIERNILRKGNKATPHVGVRGLNKVPIPAITDDWILLLSKLCDLTTWSSGLSFVSFFEEIVNSVVFNLYFPEQMKEMEIDVLCNVEYDINEVLGNRNFDALDSIERNEIIQQLVATWSDPNNEVVKRMGQFKEKSPDILKPILES